MKITSRPQSEMLHSCGLPLPSLLVLDTEKYFSSPYPLGASFQLTFYPLGTLENVWEVVKCRHVILVEVGSSASVGMIPLSEEV